MSIVLGQQWGAERLFCKMFDKKPKRLLDEGRLALLKLMIQRFLSKPVASEVLGYFELSEVVEGEAEFDMPTINMAVAELREKLGDEIYELFECYDNMAEFMMRILWGHNELKRENYLLKQRMERIQKILKMDETEVQGEEKFVVDEELKRVLSEDVVKDPRLRIRIADLDNDELDLRAKNCLLRGGVDTLENITQHTRAEIWALRGAGVGCMSNIEKLLEKYGLGFKEG